MNEVFDFDYEIKGKVANGIHILETFGGSGKSGYGDVYLVYIEKINKVVALKKLQDSLKFDKIKYDGFILEGIVSSKLKHPNIVKSMGIIKINNDFFIIQEPIFPINGKHDLSDYFGKLDDKQIADWSIQFCYAMEYANKNGINAHRDIKPSNILVLFDEIKICDFGLADWIEKYSTNNELYPGTFEYSAPESFNNQCNIQSDIYSYGIILYQMVNEGKLPFEFKSNYANEWKKLHETYELPYFDSIFYPIIKKCLNKYFENRYCSFEELRHDFEEVYKSFSHDLYIPIFNEKTSIEYIAEGFTFLYRDDLYNAEVFFKKAIDLNPNDINTYLNIGIILIDRGFQIKAVEYLNICEELLENNEDVTAMVYFNLGHAYHGLNFEKSIYYYEKCIENNRNYFKAYVNLGNIYKNELGNYNKSLKYYNFVLNEKPFCVEALLNKAGALFKLKEYEKSIEYFNKALGCNKKIDVVYLEWGYCFREEGDEHSAQEKFFEAIKINPLSISINHEIFISHLILKEEILAKNKYLRIVNLTNNDINIQLRLIREFDEYGYCEIAINFLNEIISEETYKEIALINKAKILINYDKYSESSKILNNLLNQSEDNNILSYAYELKGDMSTSHEEALINFNTSLEYNSYNINSYFNIGKLYIEEGLIDDAIEIFEHILDMDPNNMEALMTLYFLNDM